jgi:hypothetical protein
MKNDPLQQFNKKESPWRFLKLALKLRAPEPAYGHILITLANHADGNGVCFPSYKRLMDETGYKSKNTVVCAMKHWKVAGVLTWRKGWGNSHGRKSNVYQFHEATMRKLIDAQSTRNSDDSDEGTLGPDEGTLLTDEGTLGAKKELPMNSKVSVLEGSQLQKAPALKGRDAPPSDRDTGRQEENAQQAHVEAGSIRVPSYEGPSNGPSSRGFAIPEYAEYDASEKQWGARRDLGRGTTSAEVEVLRQLNRAKVQPQTRQ